MINLSDIRTNDLFSESSHYLLKEIKGQNYVFQHVESGTDVSLSSNYVQNLLSTANQYERIEKVGVEDKFWTEKQLKDSGNTTNKVGDLKQKGIKTIFEEIHSQQVFTVVFKKQDKPLSKKRFDELKLQQIEDAVKQIETTAKNKKGVRDKAIEVLKYIQDNPILSYEEGELRTLIGWKISFNSKDGYYTCIDSQLPKGQNTRPVNIRSIVSLIFNGSKYVVE